MTKVNAVLLVALLVSCLALVRSAYESRRAFAALDQARLEQRQLDAEFKRLDAEAQAPFAVALNSAVLPGFEAAMSANHRRRPASVGRRTRARAAGPATGSARERAAFHEVSLQ